MTAVELQQWAEELRENAGALAATLAAGGLDTDSDSDDTVRALEELIGEWPLVLATLGGLS